MAHTNFAIVKDLLAAGTTVVDVDNVMQRMDYDQLIELRKLTHLLHLVVADHVIDRYDGYPNGRP
ncbi:MAG: hypothetical protein JW395_3708 [Nitrospira sp.]|nr:hypothetical protein [Nitrospira sp.]